MKEKMWVVNIDQWEHTVMPDNIVFPPNEPKEVTVSLGNAIVKQWYFKEVVKDTDKKEEVKETKRKKGGK